MSNPTFSVIIPAYNAAATLWSTVESVACQSDRDMEIIIVDDGSTDETASVMLQIACKVARVRTVSQPNGGVSSARNYGASLAKGEYLAFLDADDEWAHDKLAQHRALHATYPRLGASFAQVVFCPEKNGAMVEGRSVSNVLGGSLNVADVLIENAFCTTSNLVVSREAFDAAGGFDESMRYAEDQELVARLLANGVLMLGIDAPLVKYRMSEDGLSCNFDAMFENWHAFVSDWLMPEQMREAEAIYCRYLTRRALRSGAHMSVVRAFANRGMAAHRATFLAGGLRSLLTLGGVIAGAAMPAPMRRAVFA